MKKEREKRERVDLRFPASLLDKVDQYQEENDISTRTGAIMELIRKGLETAKTRE